jgi:predicted ATPase
MIEKLTVNSFKSLEAVEVDLGQVNVFIGANGGGKSNLLEALGVLSAAADGKVNDQTLLQRGVRPGVPSLYKSAFLTRMPPQISFAAANSQSSYEVSLRDPLKEPNPGWRFKTERWQEGATKLVARSPAMKSKPNPGLGVAAFKALDSSPESPALKLLKHLQGYAIFEATTPVMRGVASEPQPRRPVGLSGGQLPTAVKEMLFAATRDGRVRRVCEEALALIDWAKSFGAAEATAIPLSPAAAASPQVIRFQDRYMRKNRNILSGHDASEGALYVLFMAVIAAHEQSPTLCAVDNADHGLNPRLARSLFSRVCGWYLDAPAARQVLLTTHNPLVLDGLPLQDDRVRLFTVSRTSSGRTSVKRIEVDDTLLAKGREGWTLSRLWVMGHLGGVPNV